MAHEIEAIEGVKSTSDVKGHNPLDNPHLVENVSYAMIVMEVLNKVGLSHQQQIMQMRGKLMDIETRMQNDFTTISEYISTIQNNTHSGAGEGKGLDHCTSDGPGNLYDSNGISGLSSDFFHASLNISRSGEKNGGTIYKTWTRENMDPNSYKETVGQAFQTATDNFVDAVKDLFYCSSASEGSGITVKDISTITNPQPNGKDFDLSGVYANVQKYFRNSGLAMQTSDGKFHDVVSTNPTDHPSLFQQYMYYQAQVQVYSSSGSTLDAAGGDITKIQNCDFDPASQSCDPLEKSFIEMLNTLNVKVQAGRKDSITNIDFQDEPTLLNLMLDPTKKYSTATAGNEISYHHHDSLAWKTCDYHYQVNQVHPGLYLAIGMAGFNYFWTKNPNAATSSTGMAAPNSGTSMMGDVGDPTNDPLDSLYMTTNSVQTNLGQQSSQGNNNFQEDVNVSSQLDNMGVNSIKSFFEGNSTMNRNSRIS